MNKLQNIPRSDGPITRALKEGVKLRRQLLDGGMAEAEADRIVGQGLKAVLGNPNAERMTFLCHKCQDSGWLNVEPTEWEMKRLVRLYGPNPQYQPYMQKCDPCRWIDQEREKRRRLLNHDDDGGVSGAGRTSRKPKEFFR